MGFQEQVLMESHGGCRGIPEWALEALGAHAQLALESRCPLGPMGPMGLWGLGGPQQFCDLPWWRMIPSSPTKLLGLIEAV